jgi:hypothetical protein
MSPFPAFPGFPNFYSSETGDINSLQAQKLGNLFFPFAQLLFPPRDKDRNPLISRFRIFRKTLSSPRLQTFAAAPPLRAPSRLHSRIIRRHFTAPAATSIRAGQGFPRYL